MSCLVKILERVVSKNTNELKTGAPGPFRSSSTRGEPQIWGSEAMSAIRVPRTRRENTVQQRDATLPGGDLDAGLYLRVHAGICHLWRSPTQASQLTLAFKHGVATLDSGSTHWYNTQRLLEPIGNVSPVEHEMNYYRSQAPLKHVIASVARRRQCAEFPPRRRRVRRAALSWLSARRYAIFFADHRRITRTRTGRRPVVFRSILTSIRPSRKGTLSSGRRRTFGCRRPQGCPTQARCHPCEDWAGGCAVDPRQYCRRFEKNES